MRHRKSGIKLNRTKSHREAMFRNMVTSLLKHDRIKTTDKKAKELKIWADHVITLAKKGDLHSRRQVQSIVREKDVVNKLFENAKTRFADMTSGYTQVVKIGYRRGDSACMALVELYSSEGIKPKKKKDKPKDRQSQEPAPSIMPEPAHQEMEAETGAEEIPSSEASETQPEPVADQADTIEAAPQKSPESIQQEEIIPAEDSDDQEKKE